MDFSGLLSITIILNLLTTRVYMYHQSDYIVMTERANISRYNEQYAIAKVKFFKFNRTYTALNFTFDFKRTLGMPIRLDLQAYKFQSNEYRLFPLTFSRDYCEVIRKNEFGLGNMCTNGNFTGCPFKKGIYLTINWGPDYAKFPPYIPHGQYKATMDFKYLEHDLFTIEWYLKIIGVKPF